MELETVEQEQTEETPDPDEEELGELWHTFTINGWKGYED